MESRLENPDNRSDQSLLERLILGIDSVTTLGSRQRHAGTTLIKGLLSFCRAHS